MDLRERLRDRFGQRAIGITLALALELSLILLLLMLGRSEVRPANEGSSVTSFDVNEAAPAEEQQAQEEEAAPTARVVQPQRPEPDQPEPLPELQPAIVLNPTAPPVIEMSPEDFESTDISNLPRRRPDRPSGGAYGPAAPASSPGDSEIVGTAPNGEPLYGARWYQEPTDQEMRGYLSTADAGSWTLIACRTAPDWRVEDCVGLEEYPRGSNLQRAALAAAWQFQVRPPRRGGRSLVGSWVRIRIQYATAVR